MEAIAAAAAAAATQNWRIGVWCPLAGMAKSTLYELWAEGRGPRTVRIGRSRFITESPRAFAERVGETSNGSATKRAMEAIRRPARPFG